MNISVKSTKEEIAQFFAKEFNISEKEVNNIIKENISGDILIYLKENEFKSLGIKVDELKKIQLYLKENRDKFIQKQINITVNDNSSFAEVKNFFEDLANKSDDDSNSYSDSDGPILNIRFPRLFGRRRSNSEDSLDDNNNSSNNSANLNNNLDNEENLINLINADNYLKKDESQEILNYIPNSIVKEVKKPQDNNYKCVICLSEFQIGEKESTLPCLHIFHTECLEKWINEKNWCPICKYDISLKSLLSKNNEN